MVLREGFSVPAVQREERPPTWAAGAGDGWNVRGHKPSRELAVSGPVPLPLRVLIVAPAESGSAIAAGLQRYGLTTVLAEGGASLRAVYLHSPDIVLLDLGSRAPAEWEDSRNLRSLLELPLVVLGDSGRETDIVRALRLGADAYLVKPAPLPELLTRIQELCRRSAQPRAAEGQVYDDGRVRIDFRRYEATVDGHGLRLRPTEFRLLAYLVRQRGRVVTQDELLERVWGDESESFGSVKQYISTLRRKLGDDPRSPALIVTVRGIGYRYDPPGQRLAQG